MGCKQCHKIIATKTWGRFSKTNKVFCDQGCYMDWKRENPNKKARRKRIFVSGYFYIYQPTHPNAIKGRRYIAEHRLVLEGKLGRLLMKNEIAHHLNENKLDNRPENLEVLTASEHSRLHALDRKRKKNGKF